MDASDDRVPVTLLTGFLGAGKTTLLNHLIRDPEAGRIAVIMNELGDVGLDHDLIEEATEETILMQSGCLCCSIRGDLGRTMVSLLTRRACGELDYERIVIETTGIADPGPILQTLIMDRKIAELCRMDGVIALADAANGAHTLDAQFEAVSQIAVADLIVVTKSDLVLPAALDRFEARLADINGTADVVRAEHGHVASGRLFNLTATRADVTADTVLGWLDTANPAPDPLAGLSGLNDRGQRPPPPATPLSNHDSRIVTASITVDAPIPADVFDTWLNTLVALRGADLLRVKGVVHVEDVEFPFVLHGVQHIFDAPAPLKTWPHDDKTSRVVVIARDFDKAELEAGLETLRMSPKDAAAPANGMMVHTTEMPF